MKTTANTITPEPITLTPEEFLARFLPAFTPQDTDTTPADYFVRNLDTGKLELHISKPTYRALSDEDKRSVWDAFYWGRKEGCWISRGFNAELPYDVAESIGLSDGGYFVTLHMDDIAQQAEPVAEAPKPKAKPAAPARSAAPKAKPKTERPEIISPAQRFTPAAVGSIMADEIENVLRSGSGFEGGKIRIAAFYASNRTPDEAKRFLKEEYGIGGCSHTCLDGVHGFVDYNGSGIEIRKGDIMKPSATAKLSWVTVHTYLHDMIKRGAYLTDKEQQRLTEIKRQYKGKLPTPHPRYGYPASKASA